MHLLKKNIIGLMIIHFIWSIKAEQNNKSWSKWPKELQQRDQHILEEKRREHVDVIDEHTFLQYIFFQQWDQLKKYANKYEVTILGGNKQKILDIEMFESIF